MIQAGMTIHDTVIILSDNHQVRNRTGVYTKFPNPKTIWEDCGEDDMKTVKGSHRMDPVLRVYKGCRVMLPKNTDVRNGIANGTQATVVEVVLRPDVVPVLVRISDGVLVKAVFASEVDRVVLDHANDRIYPRRFSLVPKQHRFQARILKPLALRTKKSERENLHMKAIQIPILINNATTGHTLQGCGVDVLFVHGWQYVANWVYVMLSRVRTLNGLHIREPLDDNTNKYAMSPRLRVMIDQFRNQLSPASWTDAQYNAMFHNNTD
jgi:hypothetical protein